MNAFALPPGDAVHMRVYPAHIVIFLLEEMQARGLSRARALGGSAIDAASLQVAATRLSAAQILAVVRNAAEACPPLALSVGARFNISSCGILGYALLSSPSRAHMLEAVKKYARLLDPFVDMYAREEREQPGWRLAPRLACAPTDPLYRFVLELKLARLLRVGQDLHGAQFRPTRIHLRYAAPPHAHDYARIFTCPVLFGQEQNEFIHGGAPAPPRKADAITHAAMLELCEQAYAALRGDHCTGDAVRTVLGRCQGRFPNIEEVAQALALNPRTLRRRLEAEDTRFSEILTQYKMALALSYLKTSELSNLDISALLGYSDASNFRRAFIAWAGVPPSHFRDPAG